MCLVIECAFYPSSESHNSGSKEQLNNFPYQKYIRQDISPRFGCAPVPAKAVSCSTRKLLGPDLGAFSSGGRSSCWMGTMCSGPKEGCWP